MASWWTIFVPGDAPTIDLNADVGEASDETGQSVERDLLRLVTSAHIACGGHAGDEASMRATVQAALRSGVHVGAHPSYPDRAGFGRRPMDLSPHDLASSLAEQIGAFREVATSLGTTVHSVKAHGALYGAIAAGGLSFAVLCDVVTELCGPATWVVLPSGATAVELGRARGVPVLREGFADRAYRAAGGLADRGGAGAVYSDPELAKAQAVALAAHGKVSTTDGTTLSLRVDTLCVHGDSPNAVAMAQAVRVALGDVGIGVAAPARPGLNTRR